MKLHLPKVLVLALLGTTVAVAADLKYNSKSPASTYEIGLGNGTSTLLNTTKGEDGVTITSGQTVGTYVDGKLVCDAIGSVNTSQTNDLIIQRTVDKTWNNWSGKETGDLRITGSGQVAVGGAYKEANDNGVMVTVEYSQLIADKINIAGDGSVVNLKASSVKAYTFTLDSGIAEIHTGSSDFSQGNFYLGVATGVESNLFDIYAPKQAQFYKGLTVNGGALTIGSANGAYVTGGKVHYVAGFGAAGYDAVVISAPEYSCALTQSGGTISVYGDTVAQKNFSITQNGSKEAVMHFSDNLALMGDATISQSNDSASLIIGRLTDERNEGGNTANVTVTQSGAGSIQLASGTSFSKDSTLSINQSGIGEILIGGGIDKSVVGVQNIEPSRSKFTSDKTTYEIEQIGSGTITVASDAVITASEISIAGTLTNNGTINGTEDSVLEIVAGKVENNGTIAMGIYMYDGELTAADGSVFGVITAEMGTITINGEVAINGLLTLGNATMGSTFSGNSTEGQVIVKLANANSGIKATEVNIGSDVVFEIKLNTTLDELAGTEITLVELADGKEIDLSKNTVKVTDINDVTKEITFEDNHHNGTITVTGAIPEPTTATLSLLALAALAARRRRR